MTTNTERKPVDVLAVLERLAIRAERERVILSQPNEVEEARAAVAELIDDRKALAEAAHAFRQWFNSGLPDSRDAALFRKAEALNRAALARVGGAP